MAKQILQSTLDYLSSGNITLAHLIQIEVPGLGGSKLIQRVTDYSRDIPYGGEVYESGFLKSFGDIKHTYSLSAHTTSITITGIPSQVITIAMQDYSFIGNKVSIYRTHIGSDGQLIPYYSDGTARYLLKGTITEVSAKDVVSSSNKGTSTITIKCANEFYDFEKVGGRFTSDEAHRGLEVDDYGYLAASNSAKRVAYKNDRGFQHANQSINVLAKYQTTETKYKLKKQKNRLGLTTGYKMRDYEEEVTKELDLRYNLGGKYLPVVYGVKKVDGIPIFADTNRGEPNKVTVIYALCEGEIESVLDIWIGDSPVVCTNHQDSLDRGCLGGKNGSGALGMFVAIPIGDGNTVGGTTHGSRFVIDDGNGPITVAVYHGKSNQTADTNVVSRAASQSFLLQSNTGRGPDYWDASCKLLDTAYLVVDFELSRSRPNIPTISAEVKGRKIRNNKTSTNPAWQIYDYITNPVFGMAVSPSDIDAASFSVAANLFDIQDTSYQGAWLPYYYYLGWPDRSNNNRAIMQTNVDLRTENPVFKNMEGILSQCMASLNVVEGKYTLTVEALADPVAHIEIDDIVGGSLTASDISIKNKYNSIISSISDPAKGWAASNVIFYNSAYKAEDNGLSKTLNVSFPYITNYYTARSLAERELKKSRYNREVTVTLPISYANLPINSPVTVSYPRYGWFNKQFLIREVSLKQSGRSSVLLREYADDVFINKVAVGGAGDYELPPIILAPRAPRDLEYAPPPVDSPVESINGVLSWLPSTSIDVNYYIVSILGRQETYEVPHNNLGVRISVNILNLEPGSYTFLVRAYSVSSGLMSSPSMLTQDVGAKINLPPITGFSLFNGNDKGVWASEGPKFIWDSGVDFTSYNLEILNTAGSVVEAVIVTQGASFTWPLQDNINSYTATEGAAGYYRELNARIKGVSASGHQSREWRYVNGNN